MCIIGSQVPISLNELSLAPTGGRGDEWREGGDEGWVGNWMEGWVH